MSELEPILKFSLYLAPLLILVGSWVWQHILEVYYKINSEIMITIVVSITAFFIMNSFVCFWIVGFTTPIIVSLILMIVFGLFILIPLTFSDYDVPLFIVIVIVIIIFTYQSVIVWNTLGVKI